MLGAYLVVVLGGFGDLVLALRFKPRDSLVELDRIADVEVIERGLQF